VDGTRPCDEELMSEAHELLNGRMLLSPIKLLIPVSPRPPTDGISRLSLHTVSLAVSVPSTCAPVRALTRLSLIILFLYCHCERLRGMRDHAERAAEALVLVRQAAEAWLVPRAGRLREGWLDDFLPEGIISILEKLCCEASAEVMQDTQRCASQGLHGPSLILPLPARASSPPSHFPLPSAPLFCVCASQYGRAYVHAYVRVWAE